MLAHDFRKLRSATRPSDDDSVFYVHGTTRPPTPAVYSPPLFIYCAPFSADAWLARLYFPYFLTFPLLPFSLSFFFCTRQTSKSQTSPVPSPSVQGEELPPTLVLLAEVLGHAAPDLRERAAHDFAKLSL